MEINEVYEKFQTPEILRFHMKSVGTLARLICDNWKGPEINKDDVVNVAFLHDIAKPMVFDLAKQASYGMSPEQIKELAKLQELIRTKYSPVEHEAVIKMVAESGFDDNVLRILDNFEWKYVPRLIKDKDFETMIAVYSDMRFTPKGIVPIKVRMEELGKRTNRPGWKIDLKNGLELEKELQTHVSINLAGISDVNINLK